MSNFISPTTVKKIGALPDQGFSVRAISRGLGLHKDTVGKYAKKLRELCPCGKPHGHKGWCGERYLKSGLHKEIVAKVNHDFVEPPRPLPPRKLRDITANYPYCSGGPSEGNAMLHAVSDAVSKSIPDQDRCDICQDLIVMILEGSISTSDLRMTAQSTHLEDLRPDEIGFRVHGPDVGADDLVSASVFASKLSSLVRALKAADRAANGHAAHDYKIKRLASSSPTALLVERPLPKAIYISSSGITAFDTCADAVIAGETERARTFGKCVEHISALASGSAKQFGYGEVWTRDHNVIRVDLFLKERTQAVIAPPKVVPPPAASTWFKGIIDGSFEGTVLEVDLRGALPEIKLILSAGGQQIDCVCRQDHVEQIRSALKNKAHVFGRAIYDGKGGLPRRVEVSEIEIIGGGGDLASWRGAFEPFYAPDWEGDDAIIGLDGMKRAGK